MQYTEQNYLGDVLKREWEPIYNRETVTMAMGENHALGTVLGKLDADGNYVAVDPASSDGSEVAAGVLLFNTDATAANTKCVALVRGPAVVSADHLVWPAAITDTEKAAAVAELAALGIVARKSI